MRKQKNKRKLSQWEAFGRVMQMKSVEWLPATTLKDIEGGYRKGEMAVFRGFSIIKPKGSNDGKNQ